jgi:hypothetical protein
MKRIVIDTDKHYEALTDYAQKSDEIFIATYGLYAGITGDGRDVTEWGPKYRNRAHELLDAIRKIPKVEILIGLPTLIYCDKAKQCKHCEEKHIGYLERLWHTAQNWEDFNWKIAFSMHMKYFGFYAGGKPVGGISGGRNLSDSEWFDISFRLTKTEVKTLRTEFRRVFDEAATLTQNAVERIADATLLE